MKEEYLETSNEVYDGPLFYDVPKLTGALDWSATTETNL